MSLYAWLSPELHSLEEEEESVLAYLPRDIFPLSIPSTVPSLSHSRDARNSRSRFISHIALCEEQARSRRIFLVDPMSSNNSATRSGDTWPSVAGATSSIGVLCRETSDRFQPHVVTLGARRTPVPHVAPTGSDSSIAVQTDLKIS